MRTARRIVIVWCIVATATFARVGICAATPGLPYAYLDSASASAATVRWDAVPGAVRYEVLRDGRSVGTFPSLGVQMPGLAPATAYTVRVRGIDAGGASGRLSDPVPVVTLASTACTTYVSAFTGSDTGGGTLALPFRTITRAVSAWQPGDVVCVSGAFVEDVSIFRGGSDTQPVTLRSVPSGTPASITGRVWVARGADDVVIANLRLDGRAVRDTARRSLPSPTVNAARTKFLSNDITNRRTRVCFVLGSIDGYGPATRTVVAYNRIHDCGRRGTNTQHGIYIANGSAVVVAHNAIFDNADRGVQLYPFARASLVTGNLIDGNGEGVIFSGGYGYVSSGNLVLDNVIARSALRSNVEHFWEQGPRLVGRGNVAARNCLGGAREGDLALPAVGWRAVGNTVGTLRYVNRTADDLRPTATSGCRALLRSHMLPLTTVGR